MQLWTEIAGAAGAVFGVCAGAINLVSAVLNWRRDRLKSVESGPPRNSGGAP